MSSQDAKISRAESRLPIAVANIACEAPEHVAGWEPATRQTAGVRRTQPCSTTIANVACPPVVEQLCSLAR
ncbi:hypothetical protein HaLaN_02888 [Haematococcus lacustris]|uniref:Uncharacterized protein n=1 Tax=Haematococcus lacustris TaxID=44745 RepID=A0A699YMD4_HAELA|nr:hypothetical protein HaLaN_02888 [Haematococcus lacustris]